MNKIIKILIISMMLLITLKVSAISTVNVWAVVWNINHSPVIISIIPNNNPELLSANSLQNFSLTFRDDEKNEIYYTITTQTNWWYTSPISWKILTSEFNWNEAKISFTYLAWTDTWNKKITITLNDWPNVISKDINLYIY